MWLLNPSDPHSTPTGYDHLNGDRILQFNINTPPYWKLKYRLNSETLPGQVSYDVILGFNYPNLDKAESGDEKYKWQTIYDGDKSDGALIASVDGKTFDEVLFSYLNIGTVHDYRNWRLSVTDKGWFLSEKDPSQPGTGHDAVYSIEDRVYPGTAADSIEGRDLHCHFDGLGENKFIYKYDRFIDTFGGESQIVYPWRPDITIEPFYP